MKKRIDVIAHEESYNNLSTFSSVEELNETVRFYRDVIKSTVKRSDVQVRLNTLLELLKRHSCKQFGVSYMCKNTIATLMELSYKTVQRLVKKLDELSMIRQVAMKRKKDMLQTANAIIILPVLETDVSDKTPTKESEKCPTNKTNTSSLKQKIKRLNKRNSVTPSSNVDKSVDNISKANFIAHWVPEAFAKLANSYYHEAKTIQEFWKVVKQNNRIVNFMTNQRAFTNEQEISIGLMAIKEFVMKIKSGLSINNIFGYFNGIVDNLMHKLMIDDEFMGC